MPDRPRVRRETAVLLLAAIALGVSAAVSCATADQGGTPFRSVNRFLSTETEGGMPVFLGMSPRLRNRDDERALALKSAAIQASRFIELSGRAVFRSGRSGGFTVHSGDIEIIDNMEAAEELSGDLEILDIILIDQGTLLRCGFPGGKSLLYSGYRSRDVVGKPLWLEKVPRIEGYLSAVGSSNRNRTLRDSISAADDSAFSELLSQLSLAVNAETGEHNVGSYGIVTRHSNYQVAEGTLKGYYVLDRWISEDGQTYYSLAVCPF